MKKKKSSAPDNASSAVPARPAAPAKTPLKKAEPKGYVLIDYPLEGEIVVSHHYAIRVGASSAESVEVSIDGKAWQACRPAAGYWWFDWSGYNSGPHNVSARLSLGGKRYLKSAPRQLTVLI